jgi:hypothetical protein
VRRSRTPSTRSSHIRAAQPILAAALAATLTATVILAGTSLPGSAARPAGQPKDTGAQNLGDPDYGVCRGTDPDCYHD